MDQLFNHLPPAATVFTPAASMYQLPVPVFSTTPSMPVQQVPLGEFSPANNFHSVHTDAAPTPTLYSTSSSSHPPYPQMIIEAVGMLRERDGSSRQAIAKFIERVYPNLPPNHSNLLTQYLKRMKDSGELLMVKHSYALPNFYENLHPGRPTTQLEPAINYSQAQQTLAPVQEFPINASFAPGNVNVHESLFASIGLVDGQLDPAPFPKKRPGRPKKVLVPSNEGDGIADAGQLATSVVASGTDGPTVKRGRGRPPRNAGSSVNAGTDAVSVTSPRGRGRPRQNVGVYSGKPLGRPRKNVEDSAPINGVTGGAVAIGRKRGRPGRPPRAAYEPQKDRNLSSRPVGRPKKNAPEAVVQVSNLQQLLAYQELKSKLEFFKSRIKHTVDILKPVLNNNLNQTASIASGALQELEELATIDVNVVSTLLGLQEQTDLAVHH